MVASSWSRWLGTFSKLAWKYNDPHLWFVNCGNCDIKFQTSIQILDFLARSITLHRFLLVTEFGLNGKSPISSMCWTSGNLKKVGPLSRQIGWNLKDREAQQQEEVLLQASGENWKQIAIYPCSTSEMQRMLSKSCFSCPKKSKKEMRLKQVRPFSRSCQSRPMRLWKTSKHVGSGFAEVSEMN